MLEEAAAAGARLVQVPGLRRRVAPFSDLRALLFLYRYFRRTRPQIVATHMAKAGTLGRLAAALAGVPVTVHTFHGHVLEAYFSAPATAFYRSVERWLGRCTTHFIAISPAIAEDLERLGIASGNVTVVRLGLELDRFRGGRRGVLRAELGIPGSAPLVGIVGRLVPVKDVPTFLAAARSIRDAVPEARFAVVGDGELAGRLRERARELGLGDRVHFTGWRRDLEDVYADLDVVMLTSLNEGTPVSLIEAGAAARPVVATRVGGVPDVVQPGVNGLLYEPGDADALARGAATILLDPELATRLGEGGRRLAFGTYGADRMVREVAAVYRRLLGESMAASPRA